MKSKKYLIVLIFFIGCKNDDVPTVKTINISSITQTSATCLGSIISQGYSEVTSRGIYLGKSEDQIIIDTITVDSTGIGSFTCNLTGLNPGTKYFVKAFATNRYGTGFGDTVSFTTIPATVPEVIICPYINVSQTSAKLNGEITSYGASKIVDCGFCWSTSEDPTLSDNCVSSNLYLGQFSATIEGLELNTKYYVRAYATNLVGTAYGISEYFNTCSDVPNMSLIGTWQQVADPDCGCIISGPTKLEITSDSVFSLSYRGDIWMSSTFRIKASMNGWMNGWDSIYFYNPPYPYQYIKLIDCNNLQLNDPHQWTFSTPCEHFKRIK